MPPWPVRESSLVNHECGHHPAAEMFADVTVHHPSAGIRHVDEKVDGLTGRNDCRVLPHKILARDTVARQHEEALAVKMYGMCHGVARRGIVEDPDPYNLP